MEKYVRHPVFILGVGLLVFGLDVLSGPYILFPIMFVIPVSLAAWYRGRVWGGGIALVLVAGRLLIFDRAHLDAVGGHAAFAYANAVIRGMVLFSFVFLLDRIASQVREMSQRVKVLEGLLPICCFCKSIRNDEGSWEPVEAYISKHMPATFSHGFCESCGRIHYPEVFGSEREKST